VAATSSHENWRKAGLFLVILLFGTGLGWILVIPALFVAGVVIRIPGVHPVLNRLLTADYDAPLMWVLLVTSWMLGIVVTYVIMTLVLKSRDAGPRSK
jgi:hypothetical protein